MTEDDWLDACADQPDDDFRRLAFADWLEEKGDADRAEFIRLRVILSRQKLEPAGQQRRAKALLEAHRAAWLGPLAAVAPPDSWRFPQGLPEELALPGSHLDAAGATLLASSPHLARLTRLDLINNGIGPAGATALASSPYLSRLTTLDLGANQLGDAGVTALASSPHLARLTALYLGNNGIGDTGAAALAAAPHLARLTRLKLWSNRIGDSGVAALATSPHLARLTTLHLWCNDIGDAGAQALASSRHLTALQSLHLQGSNFLARSRRALKKRWGERVHC